MPELRPAVYSLIEGCAPRPDHHRAGHAGAGAEKRRRLGAGQFCGGIHAGAGKGDKGAERGETLPAGQPATLYEALVKDYTGRTPEAQSQTLIITHLNKDRRALNSLIHDARRENGETGKEEILPVLVTSNIRDGELRKLSTRRLTRRRWRWLITYTTVSAKWIRIIS